MGQRIQNARNQRKSEEVGRRTIGVSWVKTKKKKKEEEEEIYTTNQNK